MALSLNTQVKRAKARMVGHIDAIVERNRIELSMDFTLAKAKNDTRWDCLQAELRLARRPVLRAL